MGVWGYKPLSSDHASDWMYDVIISSIRDTIERTFKASPHSVEYGKARAAIEVALHLRPMYDLFLEDWENAEKALDLMLTNKEGHLDTWKSKEDIIKAIEKQKNQVNEVIQAHKKREAQRSSRKLEKLLA